VFARRRREELGCKRRKRAIKLANVEGCATANSLNRQKRCDDDRIERSSFVAAVFRLEMQATYFGVWVIGSQANMQGRSTQDPAEKSRTKFEEFTHHMLRA
jgi:hypothetical protein